MKIKLLIAFISFYFPRSVGWLGSRVLSVLNSGAVATYSHPLCLCSPSSKTSCVRPAHAFVMSCNITIQHAPFSFIIYYFRLAFSTLMLLVGRQEGHPACKKTEWWGAGMVICLQRDADLHTAQLMPLPLTVSCFSKIQIAFTFLVPAHPGSARQRSVKRGCCCCCFIIIISDVRTSACLK